MGMFRDAKNVCNSCLMCARILSTVNYRNMKLVKAVFPFQIILLDTGGLTFRINLKFYFVVAVNHYTRCIKVKALSKETSEEAIYLSKS